MSTTIQIKRSSTASAVPLSGDLAVGELAVNLADKRLFAKQADGTIIELSTNPTDLDAATLRIDGVEITASATELNSLDGLTATTAELNILDGVTATATEINKLDGFTGSTAELNLLDGVTATTAELNFVDGVTSNIQTQLSNKQPLDAQLTDISILIPTDGSFIVGNGVNFVAESGNTAIASLGVTATAAELNTLDGVTASTAELNITDGLTATTTELNVLDGITATTTELNYTDGVTSNIQTQLNGKATSAQGALADTAVQPLDSVEFNTGSFTGSVDVTGTITADGLKSDGDIEIGTSNIFGQGLGYAGNTSSAGAGTMALYDATTGGVVIDGFAPSYLADSGVVLKQGGVKGFHLKNNNDIEFYEDTGTTAKMVWDASAESLSIGSTRGLMHIGTGNIEDDGNTIDFNGARPLSFSVSGTERARIDSSGNLLVGTTSTSWLTSAGHRIFNNGSTTSTATGGVVGSFNRLTSDGDIVQFRKDGTTSGSISVAGSTTSYNTSSDERLKENIQDTTHNVNINNIRVREFDWIEGGEHQRFGFIAQELETVYPEAVHSPEDPEEMKSVDYSKLVPLLVKEIQTLKARIEGLEK